MHNILRNMRSLAGNLPTRSWGWIAPLFTGMGSPTRSGHSNGLATKLTIVGLVAGFVAMGALVACPTEDDENDGPTATVSVEATGAMATEQGSNGEFTIRLTGDTTTAAVMVPITLAITGVTAAHTDYALTATSPASLTGSDGSRSVTIPTGESSAILTLSAEDDDDTTDETLTLTLGEGIGGGGITVSRTTTMSEQSASVTIVDNDRAATEATIAATIADASEGATPTDGEFTISLNGQPPTGGVRVHFTVTGTATAGEDWTAPTNNWVVIDQQPSRSATIAVAVTDDTRVEGAETVIVMLAQVTDTSDTTIVGITANSAATVTIADDDDPGASMAIVAGNEELAEDGSGGAIIRVELENVPVTHGEATITYSLSGSATLATHWTGAIGGDAVVEPLTSASGSLTISEQTITDRLEGTTDVSERIPHFILRAAPTNDDAFNVNREIVFTIESVDYAGTTANPDIAGSAIGGNGQTVIIVNDDVLGVASTTKRAHDAVNGPTLSDVDLFGSSVAWLGDFDGTGGDAGVLAVGATRDDTGEVGAMDPEDRGAVHLFFLNANGGVNSTLKIDDATTGGPDLSNSDDFGTSVAWLGDLDGTGGDAGVLAVGAVGDDTGGANRGAVYLLFLNTNGGVRSTLKIDDATTNGPALSNSDLFGSSVAWLGDLDGTGGDAGVLAVGAHGDDTGGSSTDDRGAIYLLFLNANGAVSSTLKIDDATTNGPALSNNDDFGTSVAWLGDLDGTGGDAGVLAVGAVGDNTGGADRGAVYLLFLNANGAVRSTLKIDDATTNVPALSNDDEFGSSVAWLGDLDGTGGDAGVLAVGAIFDATGGSGERNLGAVHLLFLNANGGVRSTLKIDDSTPDGPDLSTNDRFGFSVAWLGDLDGIGGDTGVLAVGAIGDSTGGSFRGAVHLLELE